MIVEYKRLMPIPDMNRDPLLLTDLTRDFNFRTLKKIHKIFV